MESVWINGIRYYPEEYLIASKQVSSLPDFEKSVITFILDWKSGKERFELKSSGSTGVPKHISLYRNQLIASAKSTLDYLSITGGGRSLLCLDPRHIAGLMMIVRSLVGEMDLYAVSPSANPLLKHNFDPAIDLAAFVPYQVVEILNHDTSLKRFHKLRNILIGGADIATAMVRKLSGSTSRVYHTFGMTETVSHIALKSMIGVGQNNPYEVMPGIHIGQDERGCLTVTGEVTRGEQIITNDLVEIIDKGKFRWLGRIDQVVNTGGIKVNLNALETRIREILEAEGYAFNFIVDHMANEKLGRQIIFIAESTDVSIDHTWIRNILKESIDRYEIPKKVFRIKQFPRTKTGKVNRLDILRNISD